jgi:FkbM family methyltransferase
MKETSMQLSGNTYVPDGDSYFANYFKGADVFEQANLDLALSFVKKWDVAIDGGAHVGSWTRYLSNKFNLVAAFEPKPENFDCLVLNTAECNNVVLSKVGLTDHKNGHCSLAQGNNSGCWHAVEGDDARLTTLPDFGALDFVKLDIEGHEYQALHGMLSQLVKYKPIVIIEEKDLPHKPLTFEARHLLENIGFRELAKVGRDVIFGRQ